MKTMNVPFQLACETFFEMVGKMEQDQKIRGEVHRCPTFQSAVDILSKKRNGVTMILSDRIDDKENLLAQVERIINDKKEITIAVLSYSRS